MAYKNEILFGRITRIHGYEGTVVIKLETTFIDKIPEMDSIFIETEGKPVPFFISASEYTGGDIIKVKFEGYQSVEKVREFVGSKVFLTESSGLENKAQNIDVIKGFKVFSKDKQLLGIITDIIKNPGQDLLCILTPGSKEIFIPLHQDFITKADYRHKTFIMDLPDGLVEIQ